MPSSLCALVVTSRGIPLMYSICRGHLNYGSVAGISTFECCVISTFQENFLHVHDGQQYAEQYLLTPPFAPLQNQFKEVLSPISPRGLKGSPISGVSWSQPNGKGTLLTNVAAVAWDGIAS